MWELRVEYLFRRPRYPLLCVAGDVLIAAQTRQHLQRRLARCVLPSGQALPVIDASGEGWALHTDGMVLSPMTLKKRWTKTELIELYRRNVVPAEAEGDGRDDKTWLKLRVDEVVAMIVAARRANPDAQPAAPAARGR